MQKNHQVELCIHGMGSEGQGIGRVEGMAVFVAGALPGERVRAHVIKMQKNFAVAKLLEVLQPSDSRATPPCPLFGRCGGCQLQHMDYPAQLAYKRQQVVDAMQRIGGVAEAEQRIGDCLGMDAPWQYRNKASIPCAPGQQGVEMGFYAQRSHRLVAVEHCPLQEQDIAPVLQAVKSWAHRHQIAAYDEKSHKGLLRHVLIRNTAAGECMVVMVTNKDLPAAEALRDELRRCLPNMTSLVHNQNTRKDNVILGSKFRTLWGKQELDITLNGLQFGVSAASFLQVNTQQCQALYTRALDMITWRGDEQVVDAYCGMGTLTLMAAQRCRQVLGIESVPEAIADARQNQVRNSIQNSRFVCASAEQELPRLVAAGEQIDVLLLDPPRKGCDPKLLEAVGQAGVPRLVYVSCNPATQARDVAMLRRGGYELLAGQPVDMFPQTAHVENVLLMAKK